MGEAEGTHALCLRFLSRRAFDHVLFDDLLRTARGQTGAAWELRRLALVFLEIQILELTAEQPEDFEYTRTAIGIETDDFPQRLARRPPESFRLEDLIHRSTQECKLGLARYVLDATETVERILGEVDVSAGMPAELLEDTDCRSRVPEYEAAIIQALARDSRIYWIAPRTSSTINSLVEHPAGTVVLVIKPPGSDWEIELKRAGNRGRPLGVLYERDGRAVPITHRLQGGSPAWMLQSEARQAARFHAIYEAVHDAPAPISRSVSISSVRHVPTPSGGCNLVRYFTSAADFGEGYEEMREQMRRSIAAIPEGEAAIPAGDYGMTATFLRDLKPHQSILTGTSSFRIETLWQYLSPQGADIYCSQSQCSALTRTQARQFADDLMEEILGVYRPPNVLYRSHDQYLRAAFRLADNRAAADEAYGACMREIGKTWGTLLAAGGSTSGESFVERNVGLKSIWQDGRWTVRIVFMDHDCMSLPAGNDEFRPAPFLYGASLDERHLFGRLRGHQWLRGTIPSLQEVYRCGPAAISNTDVDFREALRSSYLATIRKIRDDAHMKCILSESTRTRLTDFNDVIRRSLRDGYSENDVELWVAEKNYTGDLAREFVSATKTATRFFGEYSQLFVS